MDRAEQSRILFYPKVQTNTTRKNYRGCVEDTHSEDLGNLSEVTPSPPFTCCWLTVETLRPLTPVFPDWRRSCLYSVAAGCRSVCLYILQISVINYFWKYQAYYVPWLCLKRYRLACT